MDYTGQPEAYGSRAIWAQMYNDSMRGLLHSRNFNIAANGNDPPTVKAGANINLYYQRTETVKDVPTGNACYPQAQADMPYLSYKTIYESADRTFAWGAGQFPAASDSTWYLYAYGTNDTYADKFNGLYGATTTAPAYNFEKGGWYVDVVIGGETVPCLVLCSYIRSGGGVTRITEMHGLSRQNGYITDPAISTSGLAITYGKHEIDLDGKRFVHVQGASFTPSTSANTWYAIAEMETTGTVTAVAISTFDNWTISGNALNMMSIYDGERGYCRDSVTGTYYRIIGVCKTNAGNTEYDNVILTRNMPQTYVKAYHNTSQNIATNTDTTINWDVIEVDLLSEVTAGAGWKLEPKKVKVLNCKCIIDLASSSAWGVNEPVSLRIVKNSAASPPTPYEIIFGAQMQAAGTYAVRMVGVHLGLIAQPTDDIGITIIQISGSTIATGISSTFRATFTEV
jgi:hypothetical protein